MARLRYHVSRQFIVFGCVGIINTLVHALVVLSLVELSMFAPVVANVCAFFVANLVSFVLNCRFTFRALPNLSLYKRFFIVSLASLLVTVLLSTSAELMGWHYRVGLLLVIGIGPPLTFILQKQWAFKK